MKKNQKNPSKRSLMANLRVVTLILIELLLVILILSSCKKEEVMRVRYKKTIIIALSTNITVAGQFKQSANAVTLDLSKENNKCRICRAYVSPSDCDMLSERQNVKVTGFVTPTAGVSMGDFVDKPLGTNLYVGENQMKFDKPIELNGNTQLFVSGSVASDVAFVGGATFYFQVILELEFY